MAKNIGKLDAGVMDVYISSGGPETDLGYTKGGVELTWDRTFLKITADQPGDTTIDKILTGNGAKAKVLLAQADVDSLAIAIAEGEKVVGSLSTKFNFGTDAGERLSDHVVQLRLHPHHLPANDYTQDITFWRAASTEPVPTSYKVDEQRVLEVTFEAFYDDTKPNKQRLGRYGSPDIS